MMKPLMLAGAAALLTTACVQAQSGPTTTFDGLAGSRTVDTDGNVEMNGAAITLKGRVGGWVEMNGAAIDIEADIAGDMEANGGAIEISGSVGGESLVNGGAVSLEGTYGGPVMINGGAVELDGTFADGFRINAGAVEFSGQSNGPVHFAGSGRSRSMFGRERSDRSEIRVEGNLAQGGQLCAHEVRFASRAEVGAPLKVIADDEPEYPSGFDTSLITFEPRDGARCDEV